MRKTLLQTLYAAFCAILAAAPLEGGGVMLPYFREQMMSDGRLSAKSYVQDGLIAMWDGIENAGWGVHDPEATVWKDLTGNGYDATVTQYGKFGENYFETLGTSLAAVFQSDNSSISESCLEIGIKDILNPTAAIGAFAEFSNSSNHKKWIFLYKQAVMFGWKNDAPTALSLLPNVIGTYSANLQSSSSEYYIANGWRNGETSEVVSLYWGDWPRGGAFGGGYATSANSLSAVRHTLASKIFFIRRYSRLLTADEFAANYAVDKARFNLPDQTP